MRQGTSPHEEFCKRHFDAWLERNRPCSKRNWNKGFDPPDFFLDMDDVRYAVEVSRIMDEERLTASISLERMVDDIESKLLADGSISGLYVVDAEEALQHGARYRRELQKRIISFVEETKNVPRVTNDFIEIEGRRVARIEKHSISGANLYCNGIGTGGWVAEISHEYEKSAGDIIRRKASGLRENDQSILLLQDALGPFHPRILQNVIRSIPESAAFEAVYVIRTDDAGEVIWSSPTWRTSNPALET